MKLLRFISIVLILFVSRMELLGQENAPQGDTQENTRCDSPAYNLTEHHLLAEIEGIKAELARKADKPVSSSKNSKGFGVPKIGGRVFMDSVSILNQDDGGAGYHGKNTWGFREARLAATGSAYGFLEYCLELGFDVDTSGVSFKNVYLAFDHTPILGYVRVGHHYVEDGGSEICNGSTNYTFMELPAQAGDQFTSRRLGASSRHLFANDQIRLYLGAFGAQNVAQSDHRAAENNQGYMLNARLTLAPLFEKEGKHLFLYGGYYSFTDPQGNTTGISGYPGGYRETSLSPLVFGAVQASGIHKAGFEVAYQNGRFAVQTDVFLRHFTGVANENRTIYGGFVMGRYMLTPNVFRKFNLKDGCWGGLSLPEPLQKGRCDWIHGSGAWELAAYYGFLDNEEFDTNPGARYGIDHEIGLALNWYWNPQVKWALNYIHQMADVTDGGGLHKTEADIVGMSCRFHW